MDKVCHCWTGQQWQPGTSATLLDKPAAASAFGNLKLNSQRFVLLCLLTAWLGATNVRANDEPQREAWIVNARVGLKNHFKLGCWTPVAVEIGGGPDAAADKDLRVEVTVSDSDGVPTIASAAVGGLSADHASQVVVYTQVGRIGSPLEISLLSRGRVLGTRTLSPQRPGTENAIVPLGATSELIVSLGTARFGLSEAFFDRAANGSQSGRKVIELADVRELPDQWFGYDGVDVLLLSAGDRDFCRKLAADHPRMVALERWVELGGRLVVMCDGTNAGEMLGADGPLASFVPGKFVETGRIPETGVLEHFAAVSQNAAAAIAQQPPIRIPRLTGVTGIIELISGRQQTDPPLIVRTARGFGEITFVGVELSTPPLSTWSGRTQFLRALLRPYVRESVVGESNQKLVNRGVDDLSGALRQQLGRHFSNVTTLGFPTIAALAIAYLAVLGPLDYFITQRWLRRTMLAWFTLPLIVLVFAAVALAMGRWSKGSATAQLNRLELVDFDTIGGHVRGTVWGTLYSPDARLFDLQVNPALVQGTSAHGVETLFSWWGLPGIGIGGMQATGSDLGIIRTGYRYGTTRDRLEDVPLLVSATKSIIARWNTNGGGLVAAQLTDEEGLASGKVTNHTGILLKNARLLYGSWAYRLGDLKPNDTIDVSAELSPRSTKTIVTRDAFGESGAAPSGVEGRTFAAEDASAQQIVHLMLFYGAAGGIDFAHLPNQVQAYCDLSRQLVLGSAVFIAEAVTSGTQINEGNDQSLASNEGNVKTVIYRYLLPVEKSKTP